MTNLNMWMVVGNLGLVYFLGACAGPKSANGNSSAGAAKENSQSAAPALDVAPSYPDKKRTEPGELDKLLDAKPIALTPVKSASQSGLASPGATAAQAKTPDPVSATKGKFRIQIGAESDMDAAQAKKGVYEKQLGGSVDVIFDAPYYKLRWGYFDSKQSAEDKLLELSDQKIQGFVVK